MNNIKFKINLLSIEAICKICEENAIFRTNGADLEWFCPRCKFGGKVEIRTEAEDFKNEYFEN